MTLINIEKNQLSIAFATQDLLSRGAKLLKNLATNIEAQEDRTSYWQAIFIQSKANGCPYRGDDLPHSKWQWPRDTWFQEQLRDRVAAIEFGAHRARD